MSRLLDFGARSVRQLAVDLVELVSKYLSFRKLLCGVSLAEASRRAVEAERPPLPVDH